MESLLWFTVYPVYIIIAVYACFATDNNKKVFMSPNNLTGILEGVKVHL